MKLSWLGVDVPDRISSEEKQRVLAKSTSRTSNRDTEPDGLNLRINRSKPAWTLYGLCYRDNNTLKLMFSQKSGEIALAKRLCMSCPVREQCLEYGVNDPYGIFGGMDEHERARLRIRSQAV